MKNDRNRFYLTLSGVTLAHALLFWAVHQMNNQATIVPPSLDTMNFVLMSSNSVDADRAEASSAPQQAAPKPKPQVKQPEPKVEPQIKPVIKKDAKPDLKPEPKTPEPKSKEPEKQQQPAKPPTQTADTSSASANSTGSSSSSSSNSSQSSSSNNQGSVTQPTHLGGHLNNPQPPYPTLSLEAEEEGSVGLRVRVEANGRPSNVELAKTSGYPRLDRAALKTVREQYRFTPAMQNGQPIPYTYTFSVQFKLSRR